MLKLRVITALVLLGILLPATFYPNPLLFSAVVFIFIIAGAWEWGRLNQCSSQDALIVSALTALLCAMTAYGDVLQYPLPLLWSVAGGFWVSSSTSLLRGGQARWERVPRAGRLAGGIVVLWMAWVAVSQARIIGINFLFSILVLVWVADIFAYFTGRKFGGRFFKEKLAPTISPGKTREGAIGGLTGIVVISLIWCAVDARYMMDSPSLYSYLAQIHPLLMLVAILFLGVMSIVGDLVESLFKRSAGVKDSSQLLPGHGGVLDRVDALLPVLPLAMMMVTL
jgi:phosphatidate cytidylyltransferase